MLCEKCNSNPATFHYTKVVNGVIDEHHLCAQCAANADKGSYGGIFDGDNEFAKLLSGIFGSSGFTGEDKKEDPAHNVQCPNCKMTYGDFVKQSKFGCPVCYDVFGLLISDKIKKIQGSDTHVGKKPKQTRYDNMEIPLEEITLDDRIEILKRKLKEAVIIEDFEEAARLRDEIAAFKESEGKSDE